MPQTTVTTTVSHPPAAVFAYLADREHEPRWNPYAKAVHKLSAGPIGLGTRFVAAYKFFGTLYPELTGYDPPHRLVITSANRLATFRQEVLLEAAGGGTQLTLRGAEQPKGLGRVVLAVAGPFSRRLFRTLAERMTRQLEQDLRLPPPGTNRC